LEMPHQASDADQLGMIVQQLNAREMLPLDLPPHFGAWCAGSLGNNPAYVTFLPNHLHDKQGIAVNVSFWAMARAQWANAMLASLSLGVPARGQDMTLTIGKVIPRVGPSKIRSAPPDAPIFSRGFVIGEQKQMPSRPSTKPEEKDSRSKK
jgi:hypothetical protein